MIQKNNFRLKKKKKTIIPIQNKIPLQNINAKNDLINRKYKFI